jgi:hypothetical protein
MTHFDYVPNLMPPSFGQAGEFEASLQSAEFFPEIFLVNNQSQCRTLPQLQTFGMIQDQGLLLQPHQLVSPASSIGSGSPVPSSPSTGPFTPTQTLMSSFSQLCTSDFNQLASGGCMAAPQSQSDVDLQTDLQLQQDLFSSFSWEQNSIWPSGGEVLLGDDFDLNAIPPIELGLPKFGEDTTTSMTVGVPSQLSPEFAHDYVHGMEMAQFQDERQKVDGLYGFDEMMHGF